MGVAAGREHDATARPHLDLARGRGQNRAVNRPGRADQPDGPRLGAEVHPEIGGRAQEARNQREPVPQLKTAAMDRQVDQVAAEAPPGVREGAARAGDVHERGEIRPGLDRHAQERRLPHRRTQLVEERPKTASIVRCSDHRAPAGAGARQVAIGVADPVAILEIERGVRLVERHHLGRRGQEGVNAGGVEMRAEHVAQVDARRLRVLHDAGPARELIAGRPDPAARPRRGTAEDRLLLRHHDLQPVESCGHGGREPAGTGADDQKVALRTFRHGVRPDRRREARASFVQARPKAAATPSSP